MRKALYAGSFDPVTFGHLDVVERAAKDFDELVVAVMNNPDKKHRFEKAFRVKMVKEAVKHLKNINVVMGDDILLVDIATMYGCHTLVRGLRFVSDLEAELNLAFNNDVLSGQAIKTVWIPANQKNIHISSSVIRTLITLNRLDWLNVYTPEGVARLIINHYNYAIGLRKPSE